MDTSAPRSPRPYRYYDLIMAAFVTVLLCSNLISAAKRVAIGPFVFGAGVIFFPISYVFGDILTEVYGYARSRRVVWAGFGALTFASLMSWIVLALPPDERFDQTAWETVFGGTPRIVAASMVGYFAGEFANRNTTSVRDAHASVQPRRHAPDRGGAGPQGGVAPGGLECGRRGVVNFGGG